MQVLNQIGHIQFWGISPAINFLSQATLQTEPEKPLKVLISGCSDIRHILKTISQICTTNQFHKIEVYFHETQKELLCRAFLFFHILHEQNLNFDERVELFLDIYGNTLIKQKDAQYLNKIVPDLLNFIHDEKKTLTILKKIVDLKYIKFQQRDEMSQIMQAWKINVPFEVEKYRDQRLRYHYKDRYDFRTNLIDWDYNMNILQFAPIIHYYHYREWRQNGVAFENRFSIYSNPNRTLSSFIPGKKNSTRQSCLVKGYWGDIVCSPYLTFGIESDSPQKDKLFQKANLKFIGHSIQVSEYNLRYYLQKLETLKQYVRFFQDYYRSEERKKEVQKQKKEQEKNKINTIKQQQQEDDDLQRQKSTKKQKSSAQKQQNSQNQQIKEKDNLDESNLDKKPKTQQEFQRRQKIMRQQKDAKEVQYKTVSQPLLKGFEVTNFKFFPMCLNLENLKKSKFNQFFDVGVVGFSHTAYFNQDLKKVFKTGAHIFCQTAQFLISHGKEQRKKMNDKLQQIITQAGLVKLQDRLKHHVLYLKP